MFQCLQVQIYANDIKMFCYIMFKYQLREHIYQVGSPTLTLVCELRWLDILHILKNNGDI